MHLRVAAPLLLAATIAVAQDGKHLNVSGGPLLADEACYDVKHYDLVLRVDPEQKTIGGTLTMRALATAGCSNLGLDLDEELHVDAVTVDGKPASFLHGDGRIAITPKTAPESGKEFSVAVSYGGKPHVATNPPWNGGFTWKKTADGSPWIATSCQGEGADLWWPCKDQPGDKPDGFDLHITVPGNLIVASNGTLAKNEALKDGWHTFHWHVASPISNYCVALNIAPYVELKDKYTCVDGTVMPIQFFVLPEHAEAAKRCMPMFLDHLAVFEQILGPYPFRAEKYGIAETPHLGMEHQTIIAYGNGFKNEKYDWLHNHELSHEWWGNLVTCRDWKDMWIHEGFGTYMQPLYREKREGRDAYNQEMQGQHCKNLTPVAPREHRDSAQIYSGDSGNDIYRKGSWVLHTLRWQLGDEKFFASLRRFCYPDDAHRKATDGSQVRLVDTDDYVKLCSEIAGSDMTWFFEVYVRQPALPKLESELAGGTLHLRWVTPGKLSFMLAVPVVVDGKEVRVAMTDGKGEVKVGDAKWTIDPEQRILIDRPRSKR
jgi:aminopeptidase N